VPDSSDGCPDVSGPASNHGCPVAPPSDRDHDGVPDTSDTCPDNSGPSTNAGCPVLSVTLSGPSGTQQASCSGSFQANYYATVSGAKSFWWSDDSGHGKYRVGLLGAGWSWQPSPYTKTVVFTAEGYDGKIVTRTKTVDVIPPPPPGQGC
jgi:hypothetical protein